MAILAKSVRDAPGPNLSGIRPVCTYQAPRPLPPYVHPISPKVTQFDPMLRRSAEGRKSHPYSSRVKNKAELHFMIWLIAER